MPVFPSPRCALALLGALALAACTYETQPLNTQPGTLTVNVPGALPRTVSGTPTPNTPGAPLPPFRADSPDGPPPAGAWEGTARPINTSGGACQAWQVRNWTVDGNAVRFRGFRGTVRAGGALDMTSGKTRIRGRFDGASFTGRYFQAGPQCTYALTLRPAG